MGRPAELWGLGPRELLGGLGPRGRCGLGGQLS